MGLPKFLSVPLRTCHSLRELRRSFTSLHSRVASALVRALITDTLVLGSVRVNVLPDQKGISELYHRSGNTDSPTACTIRCVRFVYFVHRPTTRLRHRRTTRYGWVASPYPTGTCTLQGTPGFAWCAITPLLSRLCPALTTPQR